ncbi:MAG: glycosyltransferase family 2 protein [Nitrososphaerota archaeon]|nr:glycosyltransferase family 2 protein [Nitrososphaerota archaeon]
MTHYNNSVRIRESLDSILNQIDDSFEIVIVDSFSNDGSEKVLMEYEKQGKIHLIKAKTNRGRARQIAFENSKGKYILAHFDLDDVFNPIINDLLQLYHKRLDGMMLKINNTKNVGYWNGKFSCLIAPRTLIEEIGGWPSTQFREDLYIWYKAQQIRRYAWTQAELIRYTFNEHRERSGIVGWNSYRLGEYMDAYRLGFRPRPRRRLDRIVQLVAYLSTFPHPPKLSQDFDSEDSQYFVSLPE